MILGWGLVRRIGVREPLSQPARTVHPKSQLVGIDGRLPAIVHRATGLDGVSPFNTWLFRSLCPSLPQRLDGLYSRGQVDIPMHSMDERSPLTAPPADDAPMRTLLEERGLLLGYINVIVRDLHAAEDILQEALMLALRQRFADVGHAQAWIRVTARNLALNEGRRRQRRAKPLSDDILELLEPAWDEEGDGPAHGERLAALRACCERLSDAGKRLIDLRYHRKLDGAGMAAALGRPLNTVYVGLSRVYRRLSTCIEQRMQQSAQPRMGES